MTPPLLKNPVEPAQTIPPREIVNFGDVCRLFQLGHRRSHAVVHTMAFSAPDVTENVVEKLQADKQDAFRRIRERNAANDELKKQIGAAKKKIKARRRSRPSRATRLSKCSKQYK